MSKTESELAADRLQIADRSFRSRLFIGTAGYPNQKLMLNALAASGAEMATVSIRRISLAGEDESLVSMLAGRVQLLPNTAGCHTAKDAVLTAELAREALGRLRVVARRTVVGSEQVERRLDCAAELART